MTRAKADNPQRLLFAGVAVLLMGAVGFAIVHVAGHTQSSSTAEAQGLEPDPDGRGHAEGAAHEEVGTEGLVRLTAEQLQAAGVAIVTPSRGGGSELRLVGLVQPMPGAEAAVAAPISGAVERVFVAPGSFVPAGAPIVQIVSGEGAVIRAESALAGSQADSARAEAQRAAAEFARDTRLLEAGVISRQEWEASRAGSLKAQADVRGAQAQAGAARARIAAAGAPNAAGRATVNSPISGVVTSLQTAPGGFLTQGAAVASITNPNLVEFVFNTPAALAQQIVAGQEIGATSAAGGEIVAIVTALVPGASGAVGSTIVRARPVGGTPPPVGSPISARVVSGGSGAVTVPAEAVQTFEGAAVVFVVAPGGFRAVSVTPGRTAASSTEILSGLTGTERIAGRGAFLLKAELARGEAEHAH